MFIVLLMLSFTYGIPVFLKAYGKSQHLILWSYCKFVSFTVCEESQSSEVLTCGMYCLCVWGQTNTAK